MPKEKKLVVGEPLPPRDELKRWVQEHTGTQPTFVRAMETIEQTFLEANQSVITDRWLDVYEDPNPVRAELYWLYDLSIVRTMTIQRWDNEGGGLWCHHHFIIQFPGQKVRRLDQEEVERHNRG